MLRVFSCQVISVRQAVTEGFGPSEGMLSSGRLMLRPPILTGRENKIISVVVTVFLPVNNGIRFSLICFSGSCRYSSMSGVVRV